jgi:transcriptional regulator with XRE-family HTH domain
LGNSALKQEKIAPKDLQGRHGMDTIDKMGLRISGGKLRQVRLAKLLTRQELAELADLDESHLGALERDEVESSRVRTVRQLVKALEVSPDEILSLANPDSLGEAED